MAISQTRAFVTSLLTSLGPASDPSSRNPLKALPKEKRNLLMTLQLLYPNELLPALDLLDRDLITRLRLQQATDPTATTSIQEPPVKTSIYYVRSAQSSSNTSSKSRFRDPIASTTHYEVRTTSWSCSCPAFVFSAFPPTPSSPNPVVLPLKPSISHLTADEELADRENVDPDVEVGQWCAGGLARGDAVPMCKHLLACVLAERTGLLGAIVKEREVCLEEMVGWAAGWGG